MRESSPKVLNIPASLSAQSLGRKVCPDEVVPLTINCPDKGSGMGSYCFC